MNIGIIIDIAVVAIILIIAIIGIKRGFVKTLVGLLSIVITLAAAIFLTQPVAGLVADSTEWDASLRTELANAIADSLPNSNANVIYDNLDGDPETDLELAFVPEGSNEPAPLSEVFGDNFLWGLIPGSLLEGAAADILTEQALAEDIELDSAINTVPLLNVVSQAFVNVIFLVGAFIVLAIVVRLLLWLILLLLRKITQRVYLAYFLDKTLGGVLGLALGAVIVLIILTIIQLLSGMSFMTAVNETLDGTTVTKMIMDNNFLYELLSQFIDLSSIGS